MMMELSATDLILHAERDQWAFEDVSIITTKGYFLDRAVELLPGELLARNNALDIKDRVSDVIVNRSLTVSEFVDFTTTPLTVCMNVDRIGDDEVYRAADMVIEAIDKMNGARGTIHFGSELSYTPDEVLPLLNWG